MKETTNQNIINKMNTKERIAYVRNVIKQANTELRARHPWLRHQNTIGVIILLFALGGILVSAISYIKGWLVWWLCIPLIAFFTSIMHELEHDLIHWQYFRKKPWANHLMMAISYATRFSTINSFTRRTLHLHHHKHSGSPSDIEERGITNGEPWGFRRLLMTGDTFLSLYLRPVTMTKATIIYSEAQLKNRDDNKKQKPIILTVIKNILLNVFPFTTLHYLLFHSWIVLHAVIWASYYLGWSFQLNESWMIAIHWLDIAAVVYFLPNFLRTFCLHFISSNLHYYGDIDSKNPIQQCQVLNAWWLWPMQIFCFNFGSTHAIHHFVVREPFYIRQWTAKQAHEALRAVGVRFNDFESMFRANRYYPTATNQ